MYLEYETLQVVDCCHCGVYSIFFLQKIRFYMDWCFESIMASSRHKHPIIFYCCFLVELELLERQGFGTFKTIKTRYGTRPFFFKLPPSCIDDEIGDHSRILKSVEMSVESYTTVFDDMSSMTEDLKNIAVHHHPQAEAIDALWWFHGPNFEYFHILLILNDLLAVSDQIVLFYHLSLILNCNFRLWIEHYHINSLIYLKKI